MITRRSSVRLSVSRDGRSRSADPGSVTDEGIQTPRGRGRGPEAEVSNHLHRTVPTGDELTLSAPFSDVTLGNVDTPLLLVYAGIGSDEPHHPEPARRRLPAWLAALHARGTHPTAEGGHPARHIRYEVFGHLCLAPTWAV